MEETQQRLTHRKLIDSTSALNVLPPNDNGRVSKRVHVRVVEWTTTKNSAGADIQRFKKTNKRLCVWGGGSLRVVPVYNVVLEEIHPEPVEEVSHLGLLRAK